MCQESYKRLSEAACFVLLRLGFFGWIIVLEEGDGNTKKDKKRLKLACRVTTETKKVENTHMHNWRDSNK